MNIIVYLIFGALVGWLASIVMGSNERQGLLGDIVVGILGSLVGGLIMNAIGQNGVTGFNLYSLLVALLGAIVFIWIWRLIRRMFA